jgi:PAS domain S-box-containing protein
MMRPSLNADRMPDSDAHSSLALQRQREGQLQLRAYVEQAPQAVAMLDRDLRYLSHSRQWLEDFQITEESLIGRSVGEVYPELPQELRDVLERCCLGATESREEDLFLRRDGERIWLRWEVRPWLAADGQVGGVVIAAQNISERVRMRQRVADSERFLRLILDMLPQSIFWKDLRGKFLGVNRSFSAATGVEDVVGRTDYDLPWSREQSDHFRDCDLQVIQTREPLINWLEPINVSNGETHWLCTSKIPLVDPGGNVTGVLGTFLDVTHIKRAEEHATARLQQLSERLRSPLAGLVGVCQLLQQTPLGEQQNTFSQWLKECAESALSMLNEAQGDELPPLAAEATGWVSVEDAVLAMLEALEATARDRGVALVLEGPPPELPPLRAEPERFRQVLTHLVSRALHSSNGGHVLLRITCAAPDGLEFCIEHSGPEPGGADAAISAQMVQSLGGTLSSGREGITFRLAMPCSPSKQPKFETAPTVLVVTSRPIYREVLCRQLSSWDVRCSSVVPEEIAGASPADVTHLFADAECWLDPTLRSSLAAVNARWNIALSCYSERSQVASLRRNGVQAVLFQPLFRPALLLQVLQGKHSSDTRPTAPPVAPFEGKRVLLAEDTLENQQLLTQALRSLGCHVEVAINGMQALDMMTRYSYDLVLMDCVMPEMDGYDASAAIRRSERGRDLPIVGLSADTRRAQHERCLAAGMDDCIAKPVGLPALQSVLQRWAGAECAR